MPARGGAQTAATSEKKCRSRYLIVYSSSQSAMDRFVTSAGPKKGQSKSGGSASGGGSSRKPAAAAAATAADRNDDAPTSSTSTAQPAATVAVLLSRSTDSSTAASGKAKSSTTAPVKLAVAVRLPRKRVDGHGDRVCFTLEHYVFLDDRRRFTNLDALLTRLGNVDCVHVACTESADVSSLILGWFRLCSLVMYYSNTNTRPPIFTYIQVGNSRNSSASKAALRRAQEITSLLEKLCAVIDSRTDIMAGANVDAGIPSHDQLSSLLNTLPRPLHSPQAATEFVDRAMTNLLGGEGSDRHTQYRGDRRLMSDPLPKRALGLLLLRTHDAAFDSTASEDGASGGVAVEESVRGAYEVASGTLESCLTLDRTAAECINLLPPAGGSKSGTASCLVGGSDSNNSILGVLNKCKTKMGSRTLEVWLRQPLVDLAEIMRRQDAVASLVEDGCGRDRLRDEGLGALVGMDLDSVTAKLTAASDGVGSGMTINSKQALEVMYKMYAFADSQLPALVNALNEMGLDNSDSGDDSAKASALKASLDGLNQVARDLTNCVGLVEKVMDLDAAPREYLIKPEFNEALGDIRREMDETEAEIDQAHQEMNERWLDATGKEGQVRLEQSGDGSLQFRLPNANDSKTLDEEDFGDCLIARILKNGVYFTTKELRELAEQKGDLSSQYESEQREIVSKAMEVAVTFAPVLERASVFIAELDVLASLAYVAAYNAHGYVRPTMTDSEDDGYGIELKQARHPCVELQENVEFIPNDIKLIYGDSSFLLVTGPNMGGKSTYIRSLGAIIAMAQIGSFVPCSSAKINIVHHVLARVGAGDVQDRGISTFMAEMLEASSILQTATKRSLIIVDELGRGTSTFDGFGLATAISEYIVQRIGCMTVFATHFHELTVLEEREKSVKNCHVTAQRATDGSNGLTFLYEVRPGPCLDSFGIAVGEMANLPKTVIADAKRKAKQLENFDYRKKARIADSTDGSDDTNDTDHETAEKQAAAMTFINDFKKIPLNSFVSQEEKAAAMRNLIASHP